MAKEARTNEFMKSSKGIGMQPFTALNAAFFKPIKKGQYSFDASKGGQSSGKRHLINVYETDKAPKSKFWTQLCGSGSKLRKYKGWTYDNIKHNSIDVDIPNIGPNGKPFKIRFRATGSDPTVIAPSATVKTRMRELATMEFIKYAIDSPGKTGVFEAGEWWKVAADIPFHAKVVKMFPMLDGGHKKSAMEQESCMASARLMPRVRAQGGWARWKHYSRDDTGSDFMGYIIDVLENQFGFTRTAKDTWNPADIWLVSNNTTVQTKINKAVKGVTGRENIGVLNKILRTLFEKGDVVGISLKMITSPKQGAFWKMYNVSPPKFEETDEVKVGTKGKGYGPQSQMQIGAEEYNFPLGKIICKLKINGGKMATQETIVHLMHKQLSKFKFTIKTTSGVSGFAGLKYETTETHRSAARGGKTPVDQLAPVLNKYGIGPTAFNTNIKTGHINKWQSHPQTTKKWMEQSGDYLEMWNNIKGKVETGIDTDEKFLEAFNTQFKENPHFANTKLMQVNFLNAIFLLTDAKRQELFNRMLMMAEKKSHKKHLEGEDFYGPFGKIS